MLMTVCSCLLTMDTEFANYSKWIRIKLLYYHQRPLPYAHAHSDTGERLRSAYFASKAKRNNYSAT